METSLTPELRSLLDEVHRRMGRNLMLYQAMESALKMLLPCMHTARGQQPSSQALNGKLPTLGNLATAYLDRIDAKWEAPSEGAPDAACLLKDPFDRVVDSRNRLAHEFFKTPGVDTYTQQGLNEAVRLLDQDYSDAQTVYDDLVPGLLIVMSGLASLEPGREDLTTLKAVLVSYATQRRLPIRFHDKDYSRVIRLLKEAESKAPKVDGLTHLSWAGKYIHETDPGFKPEQLGEESLTGVLRATGMFEVFRRQQEGEPSYQVLYRSAPFSGETEYHISPG